MSTPWRYPLILALMQGQDSWSDHLAVDTPGEDNCEKVVIRPGIQECAVEEGDMAANRAPVLHELARNVMSRMPLPPPSDLGVPLDEFDAVTQ